MRLVVRLLIAGLALASGGTLAGCSGVTGLADAQGATNPAPGDAPVGRRRHGDGARRLGDQDRRRDRRSTSSARRVGVKAKEGILVDATTGQVLWAEGANVPLPIASITKVMAALVILQAGGLNREITVPKGVVGYVAKYGAEAAGLVPGQKYTTDELLHIMLVMSAADAAYTLANAYGPGLPAFIAKMNVEASDLGLAGTHFTSPDGLPYPTEFSTYSTPADLVTLGEAAMQNPAFRSIVDLKYYNLPEGRRPQRRLRDQRRRAARQLRRAWSASRPATPTPPPTRCSSKPSATAARSSGWSSAPGHQPLHRLPGRRRNPQLGLRPQAVHLTPPSAHQPRQPPQSPGCPGRQPHDHENFFPGGNNSRYTFRRIVSRAGGSCRA